MPRHVRRFQVSSSKAGKISIDIATSPASAARVATSKAKQGFTAEVLDIDRNWIAMTCKPAKRGRKTVADCDVKTPFKKRIKFRGLSGIRSRKR